MKSVLLLIAILFSVTALSANQINLSNGASAKVNATEPTLVTCEDSKSHFCACRNGSLVRFDITNGQKIETYLGADCSDLNYHPACK